ncbi:MAG: hypothetical protein ACJ790_06510 [Myxococcaceae bacterium]
MILRTAISLAVVFLLTGCPKRVETQVKSGPPRPFRLLAETPERETLQIPDKRQDIEVDTREFERTPRVVATGETPMIKLDGARARLFGDAAGTKGWEVDNFVLLEIIGANGQVLSRAAVGYAPEGVEIANERIDNVGKMGFGFEPGEVDVTGKLPENEPFKVRATALDYSGVGRVTDVFLVLDYGGNGTTGEGEDLREK